MEAAIEEVSHGQQTLRIAGNRFDISKSTLHGHAPHWKNYCNSVAGRPTEAEEKAIVRSCQVSSVHVDLDWTG